MGDNFLTHLKSPPLNYITRLSELRQVEAEEHIECSQKESDKEPSFMACNTLRPSYGVVRTTRSDMYLG